MNEELRSTAEELETSKEELQSVNEELTTVNQELKIKIEELSQTNNDFRNLIDSTDIGTVFLDRSLRVKLFTPRARDIFNLIPADVGRPLSDITGQLAVRRVGSPTSRTCSTRLQTRRARGRDARRALLPDARRRPTARPKTASRASSSPSSTSPSAGRPEEADCVQARESEFGASTAIVSTR